MDENELLAALPSLFRTGDPDVLVGSGPDDCAHLRLSGQRLAVSVDAFAESAHFLPDADPACVARKALGASLSDLAASACRARWAVVALCLRRGAGESWAGRFAGGLARAAEEYGVSIVGGDTVSSPHGTVVSVTVMGEPLPGGPLTRSGGGAGDVLAVSGRLGGSLLGRHLCPRPRLREMEELMAFCAGPLGGRAFPSAAMDISDGLALDVSRLCRESGVGAVLEAERIPLHDEARESARSSGQTPLSHALADGEDFEILLAVPPALWESLLEAGKAAAFTRIGELTAGADLLLRTPEGLVPLHPEGYRHQW